MATNLDIDDHLLEEACRVGGHKTKKAAVTEALQEYVQRHKQAEILHVLGTVDYYDDYEPKKHRKRT